MTPAADPKIVEEVSQAIDAAIGKNRRLEFLTVGVLLTLFVAGIGLLVYGAIRERWELLCSGGIVELAVTLPIKHLLKFRADAIKLRTVPHLLRLATTKTQLGSAFKLAIRILDQV